MVSGYCNFERGIDSIEKANRSFEFIKLGFRGQVSTVDGDVYKLIQDVAWERLKAMCVGHDEKTCFDRALAFFHL